MLKIELIAQTSIVHYPEEYTPHNSIANAPGSYKDLATYWESLPEDADELTEIAGRECYQSWDRPNPATASNMGYVANIIDHRHFSVLEHGSATFRISGVSRALTHELVRHRHLSYSQRSQRYVDESQAEMVIHPVFHKYLESRFLEHESDGTDTDTLWGRLDAHMKESKLLYMDLVEFLESHGEDRKTARGAARMVMPNMTETSIIVTGNHLAWRQVIEKRNSPAADAEIREVAAILLTKLKQVAPAAYQDMEV